MAMLIEERRDEFRAMPDVALLRELIRKNPFGGYTIGNLRGSLTREQAIETLLRYEYYKAYKPPAKEQKP